MECDGQTISEGRNTEKVLKLRLKKYSQGPYALVVLLDLIQALQNILILTGILSSVNSSSPRQLGADTDY